MKIVSCKVNHLENPMGYSMRKCVFSWITEEEKAVSSRICVYENGLPAADTGWGDLDFLGTHVPLALKPRTVYSWKISAKNEKGEVFQSGENTFETGKRDEPWTGKWITCEKTEARHPYFEREFHLDGEPVSARLYICGLGLYEASINGQKVTDERLLPGINSYDCWLQAQTFDVTGLLAKDNRLSVLLGNGWYKGRNYFGSEERNIYGDRHRRRLDGQKEQDSFFGNLRRRDSGRHPAGTPGRKSLILAGGNASSGRPAEHPHCCQGTFQGKACGYSGYVRREPGLRCRQRR